MVNNRHSTPLTPRQRDNARRSLRAAQTIARESPPHANMCARKTPVCAHRDNKPTTHTGPGQYKFARSQVIQSIARSVAIRLRKMRTLVIVAILALGGVCHGEDGQKETFRLCVPHQIIEACRDLMAKPEASVQVECVVGRDRMDCLEKVNARQADFVAVDPEDMYVAYHMANQDFSVFTEFRTAEEPKAEFRYEGIILVRKSDNFGSLSDLRGKKSCHTGYGRNVGYKIPITKLQKHGLFKMADDPELSPLERELKGLSELFSSSCLVGQYSPNDEVNRLLKKRYSNLCALCEKPDVCDYPDNYSGYDGAIRCLVENNGDVAFTKVIYVNKYFGLPVGGAPAQPALNPNARTDDYVYLCEDGTTRPITGPACSWAQRPWQGYMGNGDINARFQRLQKRLQQFYEEAKNSANTEQASKMWVDRKNVLFDRENPVQPGDHLNRAQYKDVIERDGPYQYKIKLCVTSELEQKKCEVMRKAAYSRDVRPEIQCVLKGKNGCVKAVQDGEADVVVLKGEEQHAANTEALKPILFEKYAEEDLMVAIADKDATRDQLLKSTLEFDETDTRALSAALFLNDKRQKAVCPNKLSSVPNSPIKIISAQDLTRLGTNKKLVCPSLELEPIANYASCNIDYTLPTGVYVRKTVSGQIEDNISHAFVTLSDKFGHGARGEVVFDMFGEFEPGAKNVLFHDRAAKLGQADNRVSEVDQASYQRLMCL
ncbi:transferrin [Toxorhynchites rutilus septentrionalis]|uniref:transferrin n=1 Tax=Toxorhynchites rutilus septentrionalis TaxID=329112 RepID=UPI00247AC793|nr:transferrin [Toxorhynchites rutilus septentrionalis]